MVTVMLFGKSFEKRLTWLKQGHRQNGERGRSTTTHIVLDLLSLILALAKDV